MATITIVLRLVTQEDNFIGCSSSEYGERDICFFTEDGKFIRHSDESELLWAITDWGVPVERGQWIVDDSAYQQQETADRKEWEDFTSTLTLNQREIVDVTDRQIELLIKFSENWYNYCTNQYGQKYAEYETDNPVVPLGYDELLNKFQCTHFHSSAKRKVYYTFYFKTTVDFKVDETFKVKCNDTTVILKYDGSFTIVDLGDYTYYDAIELPLVVGLRNSLEVTYFIHDTKSDIPLSVVAQYPQFSGVYE